MRPNSLRQIEVACTCRPAASNSSVSFGRNLANHFCKANCARFGSNPYTFKSLSNLRSNMSNKTQGAHNAHPSPGLKVHQPTHVIEMNVAFVSSYETFSCTSAGSSLKGHASKIYYVQRIHAKFADVSTSNDQNTGFLCVFNMKDSKPQAFSNVKEKTIYLVNFEILRRKLAPRKSKRAIHHPNRSVHCNMLQKIFKVMEDIRLTTLFLGVMFQMNPCRKNCGPNYHPELVISPKFHHQRIHPHHPSSLPIIPSYLRGVSWIAS